MCVLGLDPNEEEPFGNFGKELHEPEYDVELFALICHADKPQFRLD